MSDKLYYHKPHPHKPRNVHSEHMEQLTFGQKLADAVASGMGSWPFIIVQSIILAIWITVNTVQLFFHPFDRYPYILLNLMLSFQAAFAAPFIMISQNRQAEKDRLMAQEDYETDVKAEHHVEGLIGHLDAQDHFLLQVMQRLDTHEQRQDEMLMKLSALLEKQEKKSRARTVKHEATAQ